MAVLIRNVNRFTKITSTTFLRSMQSTSESVSIEKSTDDDQPIDLENPYIKEKQQCILCRLNINPDYKNVRLLSQFQSTFTGRIYGKHITGLCSEKQRRVEAEIFKAQNAGMMGYYMKNPKYARDPKLFDPNNPFRPHPY